MTRRAEIWTTAARRGAQVFSAAALLAALMLLTVGSAAAAVLGLGSGPVTATTVPALTQELHAVAASPTDGFRVAAPTGAASTKARADGLLRQATAARRAHLYTRASTLYQRARDLYVRADDAKGARVCLTGMQDLFLITATYPYTRTEMLGLLAEAYPDVAPAQRRAWLGLKSSEAITYDGARHYFGDLPVNIAFRDVELFRARPGALAGYRQAYGMMQPYLAKAAAATPWQPYAAPTTYTFTQTLAVPRSALPATGDLRTWLPLPVEGGPQTDVQVTSMTPTTWLAYPPSLSEDISLLHLNVPLDRLTGDLDFGVRVSFKHAAQYFKVDPARVGRYDTGSSLYRQYTVSRGNTTITAGIRRTARRVVGGQTNPYLAARRLYNYVIDNVTYSFMPHFALWPRGIPESVYVHNRKYGDCGAQSMYFAALCRSIGIPARTTGGFQLFKGAPAGHFWAELYLPNYGWLPVDPTAAEIVDYLPEIPATDKRAFHDFFFGNQDDLRLTVQKDVDLPLIPRANGRVALPMAIQMPATLCDTMTDVPTLVLGQYWSFK